VLCGEDGATSESKGITPSFMNHGDPGSLATMVQGTRKVEYCPTRRKARRDAPETRCARKNGCEGTGYNR